MFCPETQVSIESGYLILTMMPSLYCEEKCPHCYLSKEQRADKTVMSLDKIKTICLKVDDFYLKSKNQNKHIVLYWYGGEPTSMGIDYFESAITIINSIFLKEKGYTVKHIILTSLVNIDDCWFDFFHKHCDSYFQTSFDGRMRGKKYLQKWESRIKDAINCGLKVGTISVVNEEMLKVGAKNAINYLVDLGITEAGFLPFMLNEQNKGKKYNRFAPTMNNWSNYLIEATKTARKLNQEGKVISIGQESFYLVQNNRGSSIANTASQTLFLMPNGDITLPDYKNGHEEYMRTFGNILTEDFIDILEGAERKLYLKKQLTRNFNKECLECSYSNSCVMEFWKENRDNDDCFGGKRYIEWLEQNKTTRHGDVSHSIIS